MNSKETKSFEKFKNELKQFFKVNKAGTGGQTKQKDEYALRVETEHQLSSRVPIALRIKTMKDLSEVVVRTQLEENAIEKICKCIDDILVDENCKDSRHHVISFYQYLVQGQYERLGVMRPYFFNIVKNHENGQDTVPRFELFQKLTNNGKCIAAFEEEVGIFLLDWMPAIVASGRAADFLSVLVNYIKYNAGYIDEEVSNGIVESACFLCCRSDIDVIVSGSLNVLDAIVCYSNLSQQIMMVFISALSRTICLEKYNHTSWKIMRNLLGTHMGHFCLQTLCYMLQDPNSYDDTGLVCGMIFILNMGLLNNKPAFILGYIPSLIIPSILKASTSDNAIILVEVCLSVKWLVEKYGDELKEPTWDKIFIILEPVMSKNEKSDTFQSLGYIHDIFNKIESSLRNNRWNAQIEKLFSFSQRWYFMMPEPLIFHLTDYFFNRIVSVEPDWTGLVHTFISTFLIKESRSSVRVYVLNAFVKIIKENGYHHEEKVINDIVKPYFSSFAFEKIDAIRNIALEFLIKFCYSCTGCHMESILDILEKVLKAPFEQEGMVIMNEGDCSDLKIVIRGLLDIFIFSIYELPSSNAIKILDILVSFLKCHYEKPYILDFVIDVRWMIIDCLLKLRTDSKCRIGYINDSPNNVKYSSYLLVDYTRSSNSSISASSRVNSKSSEGSFSSFEEEFYVGYVLTYISLTNTCRVIVTSLKMESDWKILKPILVAIPTALKNRAIVFSKYNSEVESIVNALISMITEGNLPDSLKNIPPKFTKPDFYGYVIPVLSAFASYRTHLEFSQQQRLIKCLEVGLVNKSASQCVTALMICLLEMREAMVKLLPEILLNLSKISATVHVAIPILEFLSRRFYRHNIGFRDVARVLYVDAVQPVTPETPVFEEATFHIMYFSVLANFPQVFSNFIQTQYMSIFAIIFPYTNPFKYHHYIVSLAHHVIAVWFLKCRRPLRSDFVKYIIKGLKGNVLGSFEDGHFVKPTIQNEDSSNRKRSSSLTEQGNRRKERHMSGSGRLTSSHNNSGVLDLRKDIDETSVTFHRELTETCIDLMSRVAFTSCSALPKKHPGSEFILRNGQSSTWLLGNRLVTITTSGCTQKPMYNGYCDKCYSSCIVDNHMQFLDASSTSRDVESSNKSNMDDVNTSAQKPTSKQLTRHLSINSEDGSSDSLKPSTSNESSCDSDDKRINDSLDMNRMMAANKNDRGTYDFCTCWCQGWAEIHIRRATGDTSWMMRLENETCSTPCKNPLTDVSAMFHASVIQEGIKMENDYKKLEREANDASMNSHSSGNGHEKSVKENNDLPQSKTVKDSRMVSENPQVELAAESKPCKTNVCCPEKDIKSLVPSESCSRVEEKDDDASLEEDSKDHCCHARNPVRRSNSSPEMSANWKNAFAKDSSGSFNSLPVSSTDLCESNDQCSLLECKKSGKHCYSKELRCKCEAIPEELSGLGTTPPKSNLMASAAVPELSTDSSQNISDVESSNRSTSPSISSSNISQSGNKSSSNPQLPPSCSYENVDLSDKKKTETKFFDERGLPNDDFEFSRSASTSQVISSQKKYPPSASYVNLSHSLTSSQPHLTAKPPLSPPTYSLRSINKHGKDYSSTDSQSDSFSNLNQDYKRNRVHTISVMSPTKKSQSDWDPKNRFSSQRKNEPKPSGVNPSFVFLQLYDPSQFVNSAEKPILIPATSTIQRALTVFDHIPPYETHKVGVIYVGPGQANNETEILRNSDGTTRYVEFLSQLGTLVNLAEVNPQNVFLGGLEQNGNDGKFAYIWKDDIMQVIFHVATLMPNKDNDLNCNNKKKHIGNDWITVVYNESGEEYDLNTIKSKFNFACIVVEPLDHGNNQLTINARDDLLKLIGNVETKIVSDKNVSLLARQLALHINLASQVLCSMNKDKNYGGIYASNWLERFRKIKQIKKKVLDELKLSTNQADNVANKQSSRRNYVCDFTEYT